VKDKNSLVPGIAFSYFRRTSNQKPTVYEQISSVDRYRPYRMRYQRHWAKLRF
jgi:hypothetical protein